LFQDDDYALLRIFIACLEAATKPPRANVRDFPCLWWAKKLAPGIDLERLPIGELFQAFLRNGKFINQARCLLTGKSPSRETPTDCLTKKQIRQGAPPPCAVCGVDVQSSEYCGGCKMVIYCGTKCQREDWKKKPRGHKRQCPRLRAHVLDVIALEEPVFATRLQGGLRGESAEPMPQRE